MKTKKLNRLLMLLVAFMTMCVTQVWGADVTFTAGTDQSSTTSITKDGITLTATTFSNASYYQAYSGTPLKVESTVGNITKIVITCTASGTSNYGPSKFSKASVGRYNYSGKVGTWTGNAATISLSTSAQVRMTSVVVTYTTASACTAPATALSITSAATATVGTPLSLTTTGGNEGTVTWSVTNGTGSATVSGSTLTPVTAGAVTVKAHQDQNGTTCEQDAEKTITISKQSATITLSEAGSETNVSGTHYVGDPYTLPSTTSATCGSKVLVGWSTVEIATPGAKPASNYYDKGASVTLGATNKFYAVFADASGSGAAGYNNVTSLTAGKNYIFGAVKAAASSTLANNTTFGAVAFTNTYSATSPNWGAKVDLTPDANGVIAADNSSITAACIWTLVSITSGNYTFKNGSNYIYLGDKAGSTTNGAQSGISTTSGNMYLENVNSTCKNAFLLHPSSSSTNVMLYNTSNGYRMYASRSYSATMSPYVRFYEYAPGTTYSNYTTTCGPATYTASVAGGLENGSIDLSHGSDNNQSSISGLTGSGSETITINLTPADGYEVETVTVTKAGGGSVSTGGSGNTRTFTMPTDNVTVSATFSQILVTTLTFNANGGTVTPTSTTTSPATLPTPEKTGYNFAGWCENSDLSDASPKAAEASYSFTESKTLYAKWTPKTYTITLDKNGGSTDGSATATFNSGTLTGYTAATRAAATYKWLLAGYYTSKTGGDVKVIDNEGHLVASVAGYTDGSGNWTKDADATLYARWTKVFTITWRTATGSTTSEVVDGNKLVLPVGEPVSCDDETYTTFIGWYDQQHGTADIPSASLTGNKATADVTPDNNKTYYAVWADGALVGGEVKQFSFDFNDKDNWSPTFPLGSSNKVSSSDAASYTYNGKTLEVAGDGSNGYYIIGSSASEYKLLIGKTNSYIKLPAFDFKVSKIVCNCPASGGSGNTTFNIFDGATAVSTEVTGSNGTKEFVISSEHRTIGTRYTFKVTNAYNAQFFSLDIYSQSATATGFISTCCNSTAVATVTPASANLALNIEGTVSTTVNHSVTNTTSYRFYGPVITPAEGATANLSSDNYRTADNSYTFTATKAGVYTLKHQVYDAKAGVQCSKYVNTQITVAANPILNVSTPTITSQCDTEGDGAVVNISSRYLVGSSLTASVAKTSGSGTFKICKTVDGTYTTSNLTGIAAGQAEKSVTSIYVRYDAAEDENTAATGTLTITDGNGTSQQVALSTTPTCGTSIRMIPTDANSVNVMAFKNQWTRTQTAIRLKGSYLTQNVANVNIKLTSSNPNFKFTTGNTEGTAEYASGSVTSATWNQDIYVVYTPTTFAANETTTITAKVITFGGTTEHASSEITVTGKSLPEEFVIAVNTGSQWVAVPADMIAPFGGSAGQCTTGVGTHDPYVISVNNDANPTKATTVPARAVYKGYARNTPTTQPWASQFVSKSQAGYYLWGSASVADANEGASADLTTIANQNYATSERTKWTLETTDGVNYQLHINPALNDNKLGYNGTADRIGQYKSAASTYKYNFRFLPFDVTPCTYYVKPTMELTAFTSANATVTIPFDGTTAYQISTDNKANWTDIDGVADCKNLNFTLPLSTYKNADIWLRPQGVLCQDATSETSLHILNPTITADASKEFNGVQNVAFNGEFAITTTDIWTGAGGGVQVASSNSAILASYNGTTGKVELSMAAVPAGDYSTNLTISSVGATDKTVSVTIHILSLAAQTFTCSALSNGVLCAPTTSTEFVLANAIYKNGSAISTLSDFNSSNRSLIDLATGTSPGNLSGVYKSAGSVALTLVSSTLESMVPGHTYRLTWMNSGHDLTNSTGLEYGDCYVDFVYSTDCSAPTMLTPCVTGPTSIIAQWVGDCGVSTSTVNVYTKSAGVTVLDKTTFSTSEVNNLQYAGESNLSGNYWITNINGTGAGAPSISSNKLLLSDVNGNKYYNLFTPLLSNWSISSDVTYKITITLTQSTSDAGVGVDFYVMSNGNSLAKNTTPSITDKNVTIDGVPATSKRLKAGTTSFEVKGLAGTDRIRLLGWETAGVATSAKNVYISSFKIETTGTKNQVTGSPFSATCSTGEKTISSGLSANTTYYATVTNNGKTSNEVSFKTYAGAKSLRFYSDLACTNEIVAPLQTPSGQDVTVYVKGANVPGCDVTASVTPGIALTDNMSFNATTGALTGNIVLHNNTVEGEALLTITDGKNQTTTLTLSASSCPAGFSTMALPASSIEANAATANWTSSVSSEEGHLVLYKNGIVNRELIENGGFESGDLTGWNFYNVGALYSCKTQAVVSNNAKSGSNCLSVTAKGGTLGTLADGGVIYSNPLILEPGTYTMKAWIKMPKVGTYTDKAEQFSLGLVGGTQIGSTNETVYYQSAKTTLYSNNTYTEISAEFNVTKTIKATPVVAVTISSEFRAFYLDDVSLKRISAPMGDEPDMNLEVADLSTGSLALNGLSGNTEYAYKITNEDGCESNIITFHTLAAGEPVITVTSPATISAPLASSNTGVSVVGAVDAFDVISITKTGDDANRFTLSRTTLPMEGGVLHYTFTPKNTDSPGDEGSITITFSTRGLSTPTELVVNWTVSSGIDIDTKMIEVTDVANDQITIEHNVEGEVNDVRVVFNRELEPGEITANVGDEVFFSKYYEAYMHKKLWAIYNPTDHDISLAGMQVWRSKGDYSNWNTEQGIDLSSMGNQRVGYICSNEEIIVYTADQVGSCEESQVDMSDWVGMTSKDQALSFSGDDALLLVRKVGSGDTPPTEDQAGNSLSWRQYTDGESQHWYMLDIIGARKDDNTPDGSAIVAKWSWTNNNSVVEQGDDRGWVGCGYDMNNSNAYTQDANCHGYLLSTNRCLLVRRKDVKSGNNAVAVNIGDMATLSSEWQGAHVPTSGDQAAVSCSNFSFVGGYDYAGYYNHFTPISEDDYEYLQQNPDGSYSFGFEVPEYYCKYLRIEVVETQNLDGMEVDNIHAFTDYKVPIVIDENKNTNNTIFTTIGSTVCEECDVVVRDAAKLSHVAGGQGQFRDMYVYPGAKLDNSASRAITLRTIYMQSRNDEVGYAIINDGLSSLSAENIVHTKRVDDQFWYTFSLPYDCDIAAIRQVNGKTMGIYEDDSNYGLGDWTIQYYDGAARQAAGTSAAAGENSEFWKSVPANGTLKAHQAYTIGLYNTEWDGQLKNVYFPPKETTEYTEEGDAAKTTTVTNWAVNLSCEARHHGWNFVGSPYISMFNETSDGQGLNNGSVVMKGKLDGDEYTDTEHVYVSIPDGGNSKTYTQALASATKLKPFSGYFVQVVDPTSGSSEEKTLTYAKTGRTLSAPARAAATRQKVMVELSIAASNGQVDNAGVLVDDRYTTAYEVGHDLTKLYAQGTKPQLYSIAANGEKMAYIALPDEAAYEVPIGIYAPKTGNYVLSMNEQVSRFAGAASVELLYQGQVVANLMIEDYTIAAQKGTVSGYSVRIQRIAQIATSTDLIDGESIKAIVNNGKITVENLPEDATVMLYDMVGKMLMSTGANGYNQVSLDVPAQGAYNISVRSSKGNATIKTIVR